MIYRGPSFFAVVLFGSYPPPLSSVSSTTHKKDVKERQLADGKGGGEGGEFRSQIIRPQESLVFYKSFYTLWF